MFDERLHGICIREFSSTSEHDITRLLNQALSTNSETWTYSKRLLKKVSLAFEEGREAHEDDSSVLPVLEATKDAAEKFAGNVPEWLTAPHVFSDSKGRIGFSWKDIGRKRSLYATFNPNWEIVWAYVDEKAKRQDGGKSLLGDSLAENLRSYLFSFKSVSTPSASKT